MTYLWSKKLIQPNFPKPPQTDAANVKENIDRWIKQKGLMGNSKLDIFCIKDPSGYNGYRFIRNSDLTIEKKIEQSLIGVAFRVHYIRMTETKDHFCPLYFSEWYNRCTATIELPSGEMFAYTSDNDLIKRLRAFKKNSTPPCWVTTLSALKQNSQKLK